MLEDPQDVGRVDHHLVVEVFRSLAEAGLEDEYRHMRWVSRELPMTQRRLQVRVMA